MQVNPESFKGRGVFRIIADERGALYRGWGWTMARNAPGSFAVSPIPIFTCPPKPPYPPYELILRLVPPLHIAHPSLITSIIMIILTTYTFILSPLALRRFGSNERLRSRSYGLLKSNVGPELHRIGRRSRSFHHRRRSA